MIKTSYTVTYATNRPCDVVYSRDAILRVARGTPIASVTERETWWYGSWDNGTRNYETLSERTHVFGEDS